MTTLKKLKDYQDLVSKLLFTLYKSRSPYDFIPNGENWGLLLDIFVQNIIFPLVTFQTTLQPAQDCQNTRMLGNPLGKS